MFPGERDFLHYHSGKWGKGKMRDGTCGKGGAYDIRRKGIGVW